MADEYGQRPTPVSVSPNVSPSPPQPPQPTDLARPGLPVERDLWWGYLCPALANIGALKAAQSELIALGVDYGEAGHILSRVQSFYVDAAHAAARRYVEEQPPDVRADGGETR